MSLNLGVNYGKLGVIQGGGRRINFSSIQLTLNSSDGTVVGTATIGGSYTGAPTWSLTNNASGTYAIDAGTGVVTVLSTNNLAVETELITIHAAGTTPTVTDKSFGIVVAALSVTGSVQSYPWAMFPGITEGVPTPPSTASIGYFYYLGY